jgi:hypothetical protein
MRIPPFVACAAVAAALGVPGAARANCAAPVTYGLAVEGNTVRIQPTDGVRGCPDPGGMLRQTPASGDAVLLAEFCGLGSVSGLEPYPTAPYVDECVPPGVHRYGFARPYDCAPSACGTYRFAEIEVTAPLPAGCERSPGNAAPTPVAAGAWTEQNRLVCGYRGGDDDGPLGCGTVPAGSGAVVLLDALALGLGVALLRRRARARRA